MPKVAEILPRIEHHLTDPKKAGIVVARMAAFIEVHTDLDTLITPRMVDFLVDRINAHCAEYDTPEEASNV